jgi:1-pyrroline-5-carboxylate dehydrogenase
MPRNLIPKFNHSSKITKNIRKYINNVLENPVNIPCVVNGQKYQNNIYHQISSYDNTKIISNYSKLSPSVLNSNLSKFKDIQKDFAINFTPKQRIDVFEKAANLLEKKYYDQMLAYTIVSQNKTVYEAEIDAICELADFLRFNSYYYQQLLDKQPLNSDCNVINTSKYNPLNGFVASITPFNFTAIGGNLASAPLLFGNSVFWKPSDSSILSNYLFYEILLEANLPDNILNFVPMDPRHFSNTVLNNKDLGAILFTGSSSVFDNIYKKVGNNVSKYNNYVRLVGETGGKNYHFIHTNVDDLRRIVKLTIESAYNYSGQKCSACSRVYIPKSLFNTFVSIYYDEIEDFKKTQENYGLINENSFKNTIKNLNHLKNDKNIEFLYGGKGFIKNNQYYIEPTLINCRKHNNISFHKEYFAPILSCYVYDDKKLDRAIALCMDNSYSLTGSVFSNNKKFINNFTNKSMYSCGNFYINDKSTGSVVGQQPFGGSGKSGTNDKAGDINLLYRLFNQRNIKQAI